VVVVVLVAAEATGGCLNEVAVIRDLGDEGFGLVGRFPVVLEATAPRPDFLGSVLTGEAIERGDRPEGVEAGGFLLDWDALPRPSLTDNGVPSRIGFAMISSSKLSSAASASSITFGRVGLSIGGNTRADVAERRGGGGGEGARCLEAEVETGGGSGLRSRREGGGGCRDEGGGDKRGRFEDRDNSE